MVFYVALALAALISPTLTVQNDLADDAEALRGIEQTAPTIREPILASCMIEVAAQSGNQAQLTDEKIRGYAQKKARRLSSMIAYEASLIERGRAIYEKEAPIKQDLFEHKLITAKEYATFLEASPEHHIQNLAKILREYPSCGMLDRAYPNATIQKAREAAGQ